MTTTDHRHAAAALAREALDRGNVLSALADDADLARLAAPRGSARLTAAAALARLDRDAHTASRCAYAADRLASAVTTGYDAADRAAHEAIRHLDCLAIDDADLAGVRDRLLDLALDVREHADTLDGRRGDIAGALRDRGAVAIAHEVAGWSLAAVADLLDAMTLDAAVDYLVEVAS